MPDFERRSSASFISSKEGGTPASFSRSLMKRRGSYCLRVSISSSSPDCWCRSIFLDFASGTRARLPFPDAIRYQHSKTNHERTLYVRYMFRNHLISGERPKDCGGGNQRGLCGQAKDLDGAARFGCRCKRRAYQKCLCCSEIRKQ